MHIGRETDYALRIILFLVSEGPGVKVSAGRIAEEMSIPERFNLKILRKLTMGGIVKSTRGIYGGFILERDPEALTLLDVIEAVDGPLNLCRCIDDESFCSMERPLALCPIKEELLEAGEVLRRQLAATTFSELSKKAQAQKA